MKNTIFLFCLSIFNLTAIAQQVEIDKTKSNMEVLGTSSLHDWESKVENFEAIGELVDGKITNISFEAAVISIKSGKSGMDKNTYKAMNEKKYPKITFKSDQLDTKSDRLTGKGKLTIAGKTNEIPIDLAIKAASEIKGSIKLKMTDYGVTPPTAMLGTIKTGDDVTIQINFTLKNI